MATYIYTTARFIGSHTHQHIIFTSASGTNQVHVLYVIINPQHKIHIFARCTERDPQGESNGELKKAAVCMYQLSMISSQLCKYHICMYVCIVCTVWSTLNQHSAFCAASPPHCPSIHQPASSPAQCHSHPAAPLGHKPGWHRRNRCSNASTVQLGTIRHRIRFCETTKHHQHHQHYQCLCRPRTCMHRQSSWSPSVQVGMLPGHADPPKHQHVTPNRTISQDATVFCQCQRSVQPAHQSCLLCTILRKLITMHSISLPFACTLHVGLNNLDIMIGHCWLMLHTCAAAITPTKLHERNSCACSTAHGQQQGAPEGTWATGCTPSTPASQSRH